jgi:PAS domain S-box-containing protein
VSPPAVPTDRSGWASLFWQAFRRSRNAMALLDDERRYVDVNGPYLQLFGHVRGALVGRPAWESVVDGPVLSHAAWEDALKRPQFTGTARLRRLDGSVVGVEVAAHPEVVTGRRLVLLVVLHVGRRSMRPHIDAESMPAGERRALSDREAEVVACVALGMSGPEIATELSVSHNTVRTHIRNAMTKLGARTRAQLVAMSLGEGAPSGHDLKSHIRTMDAPHARDDD